MNNQPITYGDGPDPAPGPTLSPTLQRLVDIAQELGPEGVISAAKELQSQIGPADDAMSRGNAVRKEAAFELDAMQWVGAGGERFHLKPTSGKFANYEWICGLRRGTDAPMTEAEAMASRYLDSGLLLYLCATPRPPIRPDDIVAEAEEWIDAHIPLARRDEALGVANRILSLLDLFRPIARPSSNDDEEGQKKTHNPAVKPGI